MTEILTPEKIRQDLELGRTVWIPPELISKIENRIRVIDSVGGGLMAQAVPEAKPLAPKIIAPYT